MPDLEYEYRGWLIDYAVGLVAEFGEYRELFEYLYSREFTYSLSNDKNRAEDGKEMRVRFGEETGHSYRSLLYLNGPCNVLEMMMALALRCEEQLAWDPNMGDRTGQWLYDMLTSLGVELLNDGYFNEYVASGVVDTLLAHQYKRNGSGGLFTIHKSRRDMRKAEIWYQLNWYLDEIMGSDS